MICWRLNWMALYQNIWTYFQHRCYIIKKLVLNEQYIYYVRPYWLNRNILTIDLKNFFYTWAVYIFLNFSVIGAIGFTILNTYLKSFIHCVFLDRECQLTWGPIPDLGVYNHYQCLAYVVRTLNEGLNQTNLKPRGQKKRRFMKDDRKHAKRQEMFFAI